MPARSWKTANPPTLQNDCLALVRYYWDPKLDGDHGDCCIRQARIDVLDSLGLVELQLRIGSRDVETMLWHRLFLSTQMFMAALSHYQTTGGLLLLFDMLTGAVDYLNSNKFIGQCDKAAAKQRSYA